MDKAKAFLKSKLGKAVLIILAGLATLTATGIDDAAVKLLEDFAQSESVE